MFLLMFLLFFPARTKLYAKECRNFSCKSSEEISVSEIFDEEIPDEEIFDEEIFNSGYYDEDFFEDEFFPVLEEEAGLSIVGTRQSSQQMAVVDRVDIEQRGAGDLASLLQEAFSLNIAQYGPYGSQTSVHLRGYSSKRIAFLIDGVPANSVMDGGFDINQIDINSIERIEVIYGGSDSKFNVSGAMGGVINIITVKRQDPGWRFSGSVSNTSTMPGEYRDHNGERESPHWEDFFDTQSITFSTAYGSDGFSVRGSVFANRAANHFVYTDHFSHLRRKENNEVWDAGANASFVWELIDLNKLIATTNFYYGNKNIPISGFSSIFGAQEEFSSRQTIMLDMPHAFHDDLAAEAALSWHFARLDYVSPAVMGELVPLNFSRHDQNSLSVINRWAWCPGERLTLRSGFDYRFIQLDSTEIGNRSRHDGGVYLTAELKPVWQFQIIPSVKLALTNAGPINITAIPKLGLLWNVTDFLIFKNNYFRCFKFPEFEELYWTGGGGFGNPDLRPEDGWGGDIGAEWSLNRLPLAFGLTLESVFFTQWMKDSIHWYSGSSGVWRPENAGEALFFGLDNSVHFKIPVSLGPVKQISPSFTYKYLHSYLLSFGYTFTSNNRIPYNPVHTIGCDLDISWESGSVIISAHYESVRYHDRANLIELEPQLLLNATVNQAITENTEAFASLRNILNTSYESFYAYPMPGITLTLGMRVQF